jgi:hypothetical protein
MGNIVAFGGTTKSSKHRVLTLHWSDLIYGHTEMLTSLSFITDGSPLKMELDYAEEDPDGDSMGAMKGGAVPVEPTVIDVARG